MSETDLELLARYTRQHAEDAFAELVRRHLGLVHSAALRQVRSPQLAEEVAQSTFIKLANHAHRLAPDTILTAWLYQVTRREAIDVVRREARRQFREQIAVQMNAMNANADDWAQIEPLLDDAMHALDDIDRTAVLLRFFENKSLREVGATLGTTDDTARKRVERAIERLREFFVKRGVTVGSSGLVVVIAANAVQAAPAGLSATISAAAFAGTILATTATATATATKAIAMTTLQKTIIGATLAAAVGTGIYEARQASTMRREVQSFQQQQRTLAEQIVQMSRDRDDAANRLALLVDRMERDKGNPAELLKLRGEVTRLRSDSQELAQLKAGGGTNNFAEKELRLWFGRVKKLRQFSDENPGLQIPEFKLLTEQDWLDVAREKTKVNLKKTQFNTQKDLERAMGEMRMKAKSNFGMLAGLALREYLGANNTFPVELSQLKPHFKTALEDDILERYTIERGRTVGTTRGWEWVITDKPLANEPYQEHIIIGPTGLEWGPRQGPSTADPELAAIILALEPLTKEFSAANNGKEPTDPLQLRPFVKTPEQESAFQKLIEKRNSGRK
jgi:RNA polymerase sigma factor (sigma-70 family)